MANALLNILDVTKLGGNDQEVGLLEATLTYAPELNAIMGRPIAGTQYKTIHRTLPTATFRQPNNGSDTVKGQYEQDLKECALIDVQLQADKAVVDAQAKSGPLATVEDLLVVAATEAIKSAYITIGSQVWYGTSADANGFIGVNSITGALNASKNNNPAVVGAGASSANVMSSAYLIWESTQGSHFIFGNETGFVMLPEWRIQQVNGANSKPMTAYVNNLQGWIGFAVNHHNSVARIGNIHLASENKPLTDALVAQLLSVMPLQMRQDIAVNANAGGGVNKWSGGLKLFMNPAVAYSLQTSRSAAYGAITAAGSLVFAQMPAESNGVPIVITDSITNTEAVLT